MSRNVLRGFDRDRFAAARTTARMTRGDVARLAGIRAEETIRRWEKGDSSPQIDLLGHALQAIGIGAEDVIVTDPGQRYLSDWRHLQLLTQPQAARLAGMETTLVTRLERGERELTDDRAARLAKILKISIGEVRLAYERARRRPPGTPA